SLRQKHFGGLPEMVMNYFRLVAHETRLLMAALGVTHRTDIIGRTDLLEIVSGESVKQQKLDLEGLLHAPVPDGSMARFCTENNQPNDPGMLNGQLFDTFREAVQEGRGGSGHFSIRNTDRSVGTRLSGEIAYKYGSRGMSDSPLTIDFAGTAGQSFGVWNANGLHLRLRGDANDYVGKGMAGGSLVIRPPEGVAYKSEEAVIIGNTCLYGATGGRLFAAGRAGERFAVRNSGASAVVEGIGDNGCEYMTGGIVTILGDTGVNFGAGMTGGFAYVLDLKNQLEKRINPELVEVLPMEKLAIHQEHLRGIISTHLNETGSERAESILEDFAEYSRKFKLVKAKGMDVKNLLGHHGDSIAEFQAEEA
ncbi:MAG: glutamate synthase large subunit, partial [Gammaproteobacteria bacterium]|nr:glutamate synthase large subunit [Gammaproteobacteria bacterium]